MFCFNKNLLRFHNMVIWEGMFSVSCAFTLGRQADRSGNGERHKVRKHNVPVAYLRQ